MKIRQLMLILSCVLLASSGAACGDTTEGDPGNNDPGNNDPGNNDPGNNDPGNNDPGNNDPGNNDPGNLSCDDFAACGGDLVGSWDFVDVCVGGVAENPFGETCPEATLDIDFEFSGTVEIGADGTYSVSIENTSTVIFEVPTSCLGGTCAPLEEDFECDLSGDVCTCTQTEEDTDEDSGTFEVNGNTATFTSDDGTVDDMEFCVSGNSALLKPEPDEEASPELVFEIARQ